MKLKHLFSVLTVLVMSFSFTSCNSGEDLFDFSNIVTYAGVQSGRPAVVWQEMNDAPQVTLLLDMDGGSFASVNIGDRLFVAFTAPDYPTNNMLVKPYSIGAVSTIQPMAMEAPETWDSEPFLYINMLYRSGDYLNIVCLLPDGTEPDKLDFKFYVDPQTIGTQNVVAWLGYTNPAAGETVANIYTYYKCVDLRTLMNGASETLTVNMHNGNWSINYGSEVPGTLGPDHNSIVIPLQTLL